MLRRSFLLTSVGLIAACTRSAETTPSDAWIIQSFDQRREDFSRLVDVVTTEPQVASADIEKDGTYRISPGGLPPAKIDHVVTATRALGVLHVGVPPVEPGTRNVQFLLSAAGLSTSGTSKSLVYSEGPMEGEAVADTDTTQPTSGLLVIHRKIAEHWYILKVSN
jgi:hypothetical protein